MVSTASSATMDLAQVIPQLLAGLCQELCVEAKDLKLVVVANEGDIDLKPIKQLRDSMEDVAWEFKPKDALHNPEPYLELQFQAENLLMHPHTCAQGMIASDVRGSNAYMDACGPASLYQVGSYGSRLSALRSKVIVAMEGNFTSKDAPRMGEVKNSGVHINQQVPERLSEWITIAHQDFLAHPHMAHEVSQGWRSALFGV